MRAVSEGRCKYLFDYRVHLLQRAAAALDDFVLGLRPQIGGIDAVVGLHGSNHTVVCFEQLHYGVVAEPRKELESPAVGTGSNALLAGCAEV